MSGSAHPAELREHVEAGLRRLAQRTGERAPSLAVDLERWQRGLAGDDDPARYFLHEQAFPMLLLPWWADEALRGRADARLQRELAYATLTGYYFVRLVDDTMDRDRPPPAGLMPALIVLHTEMQVSYAALFQADHPFWTDFVRFSYEAAEMASADAGLADVTREDFLRVSSRKVAGAKLPLAALFHRHGRVDLLEDWTSLVDLLGRWHQMSNDVQGWSRDAARGASTYLLCEGRRRGAPGGPGALLEWLLDDGLEWGWTQVDAFLGDVLAAAAKLDARGLVVYLTTRRQAQQREREEVAASVEQVRALARALG